MSLYRWPKRNVPVFRAYFLLAAICVFLTSTDYFFNFKVPAIIGSVFFITIILILIYLTFIVKQIPDLSRAKRDKRSQFTNNKLYTGWLAVFLGSFLLIVFSLMYVIYLFY